MYTNNGTNKNEGASVSLVLGSGGARALAHIGIIHWLEEAGFVIKSVSGASMGALVGGIYAAGRLDTYLDWVCALNQTAVLRFLDFSFSSGALLKGDRIIETLKSMVGPRLIEDLPIDHTAVASSTANAKYGFQKVRCSRRYARPSRFQPVKRRLLTDRRPPVSPYES